MSLSVVNDNVMASSSLAPQARLPLVIPSATYDLNALGLGPAPGPTMYFVATSAVTTLTLPVNYSSNKDRVLHFSSQNGAVTVAQVGVASGAVFSTAGVNINSAGAVALLAATGNWATLVCDGSTGWLVAMSG
jgi:hypothetical protein